MTEQQAKHTRKLNQAVNDAIREMPERYTTDWLGIDAVALSYTTNMAEKRKLSTKIIAGLLKWQIDNL